VWLPLIVASPTDEFTLTRVTVRAAGDAGGQLLGESPEVVGFAPATKQRRVSLARGLGPNYALSCVRANLRGLDLSQPRNRWFVIEAEVTRDDGETRRLAATTFLDVSPLPTAKGWHAGDAHVHSAESDGHLPLDEVVGHAKSASGLAWMALTDHAKSIRSWHEYVAACGRAQASRNVLVCPGAEFSGHRWLGEGHVLGYSLGTDAASQLPIPDASPQGIIDAIAHQGPDSFAGIAHPYGWRYDWRDWGVSGFRAIELATGGGPKVQLRTRDRWFGALRKDLRAWSGAGDSVDFVVGLASTDSHAIPLSVMPGERHLNWVHTGDTTPPSDAKPLFAQLRAGHCAASCGGDFGALFVDGSGPGSVCRSVGTSPLTCTFQTQARAGHRLDRVRLRGPGGLLGEWKGAGDGAFTFQIEPPSAHSFYVAEFTFADVRGERWEVWTNPVWLRRS
jgi:hypothetical protein